jgi:hypothetical protein
MQTQKVSEAHEHELTLDELKSERKRLEGLIGAGTAKRADASRLHRVLSVIKHIEAAQAESAAAT